MILVPTEFERQQLANHLSQEMHLCGFGVIAAAARAMQLINEHQPERVVLIGIAGTLDEHRLRVNEAAIFREVYIDGIGVGAHGDHRSAMEVGFEQFADVGEWLPLHAPKQVYAYDGLLSVCAASANLEQANWRRERFPDCLAEEMEGFGVALACKLADLPLTIIRGISNVAGDRKKSNWQIAGALEQAAQRFSLISADSEDF